MVILIEDLDFLDSTLDWKGFLEAEHADDGTLVVVEARDHPILVPTEVPTTWRTWSRCMIIILCSGLRSSTSNDLKDTLPWWRIDHTVSLLYSYGYLRLSTPGRATLGASALFYTRNNPSLQKTRGDIEGTTTQREGEHCESSWCPHEEDA